MVKRNHHTRPAFNWRKIGRRIFGFGALSLGGLGLGLMGYLGNELFSIQRIDIPQASAELRKAILAEIKAPLDFTHSRPSRIRNQLLEALPDIAEVQIERRLPHTLIISARKRQPIALWANAGDIYLVDAKGRSYRRLRPSEDLDLPLLRMPEAMLPEASQLMSALVKVNRAQLQHLSECIGEDYGWRLYFDGGQRWLLPRNQREGRVLDRLYHLLNKSRWHDGSWWVDARYSKRWFIRQARHGGMI